MTAPPKNGYYALPLAGSSVVAGVVHVVDGAVFPVYSSRLGSSSAQWYRYRNGSLGVSADSLPVPAEKRQALATLYVNVFDDTHSPVWHWEGEQKADLTVDDLIICAPVYGFYALSALDSTNFVRIADGGEVFPLYGSLNSGSASWWTYNAGAASQATNAYPLQSSYVEAVRDALVAVFGDYEGLSVNSRGELSVSPLDVALTVV